VRRDQIVFILRKVWRYQTGN